MLTVNPCITLAPMARREPANKTDQVNFRLKTTTIERMEAYKARHPLHPNLTQIVEAAVADWLDAHEPDLPPARKSPR